ncbi:MAG TPA: sensor histidine kinase [Methanothermobacter sp.]|nr:sensor histidine kinase [Methanothermobacter sp.]
MLDANIVTASLLFIVWFILIWPTIKSSQPDPVSMVISLLYLFLNLILLITIQILLFNENKKIHDLPLILFVVGFFFQILGDMVYSYHVVTPTLIYKWLFSALFATNSIFLILAAASISNKVNLGLRNKIDRYMTNHPDNHNWISFLPLILVLGSYGLLIITKPDVALIWGVGVIIILVVLRQIILFNDANKAKREQEIAKKMLKKSLKEKEFLLREIHHRVKNNLQVILSLLSLQSQNLVDDLDQELFMESQYQIRSMALIHEKLYESDNISSINFSDYLETLLDSLIHNSDYNSSQISYELDVEEIELNIETSVPCGLILNELVFNFLKHSFMPDTEGKIIIRMHKESDQYLLNIAFKGSGNFVTESLMQGKTNLGLNLVDVLVKQLDGSLKISHDKGTVYKIVFKELEYNPRIYH